MPESSSSQGCCLYYTETEGFAQWRFGEFTGVFCRDGCASADANCALCSKKNASLLNEEGIDEDDRIKFARLKAETAGLEDVKNSLVTIMRMMKAVYGKPVILLIDEYDVPLAKAESSKNKEYYQRMLDVLRGIMSTSLKTNEFLKFSVVTGCLQISKESIFTGVNNFACYSVTTRKFSRYFGFEPYEVREMLGQFDLADKYELIRQWYDGYIFGNTEVFCPWDVASYIASILDNEEEEPQNFWANTSSNAILDDFVNHREIDASAKFEILLNGGTITQEISEELTYDHMADSEKNLWSVLLMTGYVSKADKSSGRTKARIKIPNTEIASLFKEAVVERFNRRMDATLADAFIAAMWNKDELTATESLCTILWNSISYFDYGEEYYHGLLNGIFTSRCFTPDSNDEAGLGRLDLRVRDHGNRRLLIFEFKRVKTKNDLDAGCDEAISQIIKNGYAKTMPEGYEQQIVYGIAFFAKMAKVKRMK